MQIELEKEPSVVTSTIARQVMLSYLKGLMLEPKTLWEACLSCLTFCCYTNSIKIGKIPASRENLQKGIQLHVLSEDAGAVYAE